LAGLKRGDVLVATLIFILSEATIFGTAFSSYVWLRASYPTWPPPVDGKIIELVDVTVPLINSIFLFASGGTMHVAYEMLKRGFVNRFKIFLALTFILGTIFIIGQIIEYSHSGLSIKDGVYGSTFYLITGLHGTHVIMGLAFMLVIMAMVLKRKLSKERYHPVLACTLYWHFVDIVWVFVLAIVYFNLIQPPVIIHHI
jgi:heme/copper-type cytochrome/quinol oxidase subunit 3